MPELKGQIFERGSAVYIVAPVTPATPSDEEIAKFAFGGELAKTAGFTAGREHAPNKNILWMHGQYVEADQANLNKQMWTGGDLAIAAITPRFMPITVMHDPSTAVGLIADTALLTPEKDSVPRARIDNELALWQHRFPEIAEEALHNAKHGELMQSMECLPASYDCAECGMKFHPMPGHAEQEFWCAHLDRPLGERAIRILRGVTFTGTGLIFGSRGAKGAYPEAHLEVEELAEFHERLLTDSRAPRRPTKMGQISVEQSEYDRIIKERDEAKASLATLTDEKAQAETKAEQAEAAKVKAEEEAKAEKKRADDAEEKSNQGKLRDERLAKLGKGFMAKIEKVDTVKARFNSQAAELTDEKWEERVVELEALLEVKRDDKGETPAPGAPTATSPAAGAEPSAQQKADEEAGLFSKEEVAQSGVAPDETSGVPAATPGSDATRRTIVGSLARSFGPKAPAKG